MIRRTCPNSLSLHFGWTSCNYQSHVLLSSSTRSHSSDPHSVYHLLQVARTGSRYPGEKQIKGENAHITHDVHSVWQYNHVCTHAHAHWREEHRKTPHITHDVLTQSAWQCNHIRTHTHTYTHTDTCIHKYTTRGR